MWGLAILSIGTIVVGLAVFLAAMAIGVALKKLTGRDNLITRWMART